MHWVSGLENSRPVNRSILPNFRICYFKHEKISGWTKAWELIAERSEFFDVGDWTTLLQNICSSNWNTSPKFRVFKRRFLRWNHQPWQKISTAFIAKLLRWWALQSLPTMRTPGTKRWSCDFVTGCFLPLPAVGRCNRQRVFFLSQLAPHGLTRQRDLVTMTPTLSVSVYIYIY